MRVVSMLFQIGLRRPGSVGFWTLKAIMNLMSILIMFQPLAWGVKFYITNLTICIMATSNMILKFFFVVIYFRSFITLKNWLLQVRIVVSLEISCICKNNISKFTKSSWGCHMRILMFIILIPNSKFLSSKLANVV